MKIFIINPGMVDDYVYELATAMSKNNTSVHVFGSNDYKGKNIIFKNFNYYNYLFDVNNNENINRFPIIKSLLKGLLYFFMHFYLLYSVYKIKPQIIHFQWSRIATIDSFFLYFYKKIPIVYTMHNTTLNHGDPSYANFLSIGFKIFLSRVSCILVHTQYSKRKLSKIFEQFVYKTEIISHGLLKFKSKNKKNKVLFNFTSDNIILFFGNIEHYKGLDILINAMYYLKKDNINLLIVGRGHISLENLKQLSKKLGIEKNIFWRSEYIDEQEVPQIFQLAKAIILPHRHIDQSGVLMSAINFGIPIIASNIGGFSEIIEDGKNGFLFEKENPENLAIKIKKFFIEDYYKRMSNQVAILKKKWKTWDEIAIETIEIYTKVLNKKE
jgi:glycosyltransferase involved in cell wall biosynthesis